MFCSLHILCRICHSLHTCINHSIWPWLCNVSNKFSMFPKIYASGGRKLLVQCDSFVIVLTGQSHIYHCCTMYRTHLCSSFILKMSMFLNAVAVQLLLPSLTFILCNWSHVQHTFYSIFLKRFNIIAKLIIVYK